MAPTLNGGYIIGGISYSNNIQSHDIYLVKIDENGNLMWTKTMGGIYSDYCQSIIQTSDGGYAIGGWTLSFGSGLYDFFVSKVDSIGTIEWTKAIGDVEHDCGYSIVQTQDGGYLGF